MDLTTFLEHVNRGALIKRGSEAHASFAPTGDGELRIERVCHAEAPLGQPVSVGHLCTTGAIDADHSGEAVLLSDPRH